MKTTPATILFAGGGSGGHISPGLAIAERLKERAAGAKVLFVCSSRAIDAHMLTDAGVAYTAIPARPPSAHPLEALRFLRSFVRSRRICGGLMREHGVQSVVALGGFVAAPAVLAARSAGADVTLLNLDDPPGRANRWMAGRCARVWTAIELPTLPGFAQRVVGMPIRRCALVPGDAADCRRRLGLEEERPTLFITGASQGATSINRFMAAMAEARSDCLADWQIIHLAGDRDAEALRRTYSHCGIRARIEPFLDEIGLAWGAADLAVSRAGASSVAEAAANAVPTLFLPYPYHRDMHQLNNARPLAEMEAAVIIEDQIDAAANVAHVGPALEALMRDEARRAAMRRMLEAQRPPDAADTIAALLLGQPVPAGGSEASPALSADPAEARKGRTFDAGPRQ
jgi:UDP-N-acetylglucosamine--N-acetylmuramyl-(pentapeptide) pyrophosphoryl-undecaprenol N-acetylglucosamine transferase